MLKQHTKDADSKLEHHRNCIAPFWQSHAEEHHFTGCAELEIYYAYIASPKPANKTLVISPGRTESYIKYKELCYDFAQQGYDIYVIDHRGQGFSERESMQQQLGDVADFNYYIDDLHSLVSLIKAESNNPLYLLAHSMGGAIAAGYLLKYPDTFTAAALSAPMLSIHTSGLPIVIAETLAKYLNKLQLQLTGKPGYGPGQGAYKPKNFANNSLTKDFARYQIMMECYQQHPIIKLGGPSNRWLDQSFIAMKQIVSQAASIRTPLLLCQAELDQIVSREGQNKFVEAMKQGPLTPEQRPFIQVQDAEHEILFEIDSIRQAIVDQIIEFYQQQSRATN